MPEAKIASEQHGGGTVLFEWPTPGSFRSAAEAENLPLFGSNDHSAPPIPKLGIPSDNEVVSRVGSEGKHVLILPPPLRVPSIRPPPHPSHGLILELSRASFLFVIFAPFFAIGLPLLLFSAWLPNKSIELPTASLETPGRSLSAQSPDRSAPRQNPLGRNQLTVVALRRVAWRTLLLGCRGAGAAMIKVRSRCVLDAHLFLSASDVYDNDPD